VAWERWAQPRVHTRLVGFPTYNGYNLNVFLRIVRLGKGAGGAGENCGVFAFIGGKDRAPGIAPGTSMSCHLSPPAECIPNTVFSSVSCVMCACRNTFLCVRALST